MRGLALAILPEFAALAAGAPVWLVAPAAFCGGFGLAIHVALWFTVLQREVPEHAQSRVSAYDAFGSFVLTPLGAAIAGGGGLPGEIELHLFASEAPMARATFIPSRVRIRIRSASLCRYGRYADIGRKVSRWPRDRGGLVGITAR